MTNAKIRREETGIDRLYERIFEASPQIRPLLSNVLQTAVERIRLEGKEPSLDEVKGLLTEWSNCGIMNCTDILVYTVDCVEFIAEYAAAIDWFLEEYEESTGHPFPAESLSSVAWLVHEMAAKHVIALIEEVAG